MVKYRGVQLVPAKDFVNREQYIKHLCWGIIQYAVFICICLAVHLVLTFWLLNE